jgi:hypothetical protein
VPIALNAAATNDRAPAARRGDDETTLGDESFHPGDTDSISARIAKDGGLPALYADLVNGDRPIFVQHVGDVPDEGWVAFGAFDPDQPTCLVQIDREAKILVNGCDPEVTYPLDGEGLRFYPTTVEGGRVIVDINEIATSATAGG